MVTQIPVFVVSLKSSSERKNHTIAQFDKMGISYQIIDAISSDHQLVTEIFKDRKPITSHGTPRYMKRAEVGCALSHMHIYRKMVLEHIEVACIFEDDNDYSSALNQLLDYNNLNVTPWDMLMLGHRRGYKQYATWSRAKKELPVSGYKIGQPIEIPLGTYAYVIKRNAAELLLNHCNPITMAADHFTGRASVIGVNTYILSPPCAINNPRFKSTINFSEESYFLDNKYNIRRKYFRKLCQIVPGLREFVDYMFAYSKLPILVLRKFGLVKNDY
jgi:glycosyl transferase family 25